MADKKRNALDDDPKVDVKEMARLTGLSIFTIYHWIQCNKLPWDSFQVTGVKRVSKKSDVLAWLETVRVPAGGARNTSFKKEVMPVV